MKRRLFAVCAVLCLLMPPVEAQPAAALQMEGLTQPVEIIRDRWGINHIYAQNETDLFFAQGYAAARVSCGEPAD